MYFLEKISINIWLRNKLILIIKEHKINIRNRENSQNDLENLFKHHLNNHQNMEMEKSIEELREQLSEIGKEKEKYFYEKEELKKQILFIIRDVKSIKEDNDKFSISIKEIREKRDHYNGIVKDLIEKIKLINEKKKELINKNNIKDNPSRIKEQIERLETRKRR